MTTQPMPHLEARARRLIEIVSALDPEVLRGQPADVLLAELFRNNKGYGSKDRRLISNTVFSFFRWRGWVMRPNAPDYVQAIAWAHALDSDEWNPVIRSLLPENTPIEPCGTLTLEQKAKAVAVWGNLAHPLTAEQLVPAWLPAAIEGDLNRVIDALQCRPPLWLRVNRGHNEQTLTSLTTSGFTAQSHSALTQAYALDKAISRQLIPRHAEIQDLASQCVGLVCDPQPGSAWWDVCAGAGGKTLHLADIMHRQGQLWATDIRIAALKELQRRARITGASVIIRTGLTDQSAPTPDGLFDGVLVDAPCSGIGTWSRSPDARWRMDPKRISKFAKTQIDLLSKAADRVRPGGRLVYAVCTLTSKETTQLSRSFAEQRPEFTPDPCPHPLTGQMDPSAQTWIGPWEGPCDGMYMVRWLKQS